MTRISSKSKKACDLLGKFSRLKSDAEPEKTSKECDKSSKSSKHKSKSSSKHKKSKNDKKKADKHKSSDVDEKCATIKDSSKLANTNPTPSNALSQSWFLALLFGAVGSGVTMTALNCHFHAKMAKLIKGQSIAQGEANGLKKEVNKVVEVMDFRVQQAKDQLKLVEKIHQQVQDALVLEPCQTN